MYRCLSQLQHTDISQYMDASVALRRDHGSDTDEQEFLHFFTLLSLNFNGKNIYINNLHFFLIPIVPIFMTKFSKTTPFIWTFSLKSSLLQTECSVFIKSGSFKRCLLLNETHPNNLYCPTSSHLLSSLAHILLGVHNCHFPLLSFNPQFIICSFKCIHVNSLRMSSLPAGLFPEDFLWPNVTPKCLHLWWFLPAFV